MARPIEHLEQYASQMPHCETKYFGTAVYEDSAVLQFPAGLPGFESEARFLLLEQPGQRPLAFLQSLATPGLCFVTLPALSIDPSYELEVAEADLDLLGLDGRSPPRIGGELLCLAIVTVAETGITANLLAPLVINTRNLRGAQAIAPSRGYSHQHPLGEAEEAPCS